jgi:hypothetical protein
MPCRAAVQPRYQLPPNICRTPAQPQSRRRKRPCKGSPRRIAEAGPSRTNARCTPGAPQQPDSRASPPAGRVFKSHRTRNPGWRQEVIVQSSLCPASRSRPQHSHAFVPPARLAVSCHASGRRPDADSAGTRPCEVLAGRGRRRATRKWSSEDPLQRRERRQYSGPPDRGGQGEAHDRSHAEHAEQRRPRESWAGRKQNAAGKEQPSNRGDAAGREPPVPLTRRRNGDRGPSRERTPRIVRPTGPSRSPSPANRSCWRRWRRGRPYRRLCCRRSPPRSSC